LRGVRGLWHKQDGQLTKTGKGEHIDLNDFPACAPRFRRFGPVEITRGCIYACKFCQTPFVNKARFRHRSVENIVEAVHAMKAREFIDYRFISPSSLSYGSADESVNLAAIESLLSSVRQAAGKTARIFFGTFPSEVRPEHVSKDVLKLLKQFVNNDNLIIGGQSGSQAVLDLSHRGHTVDAIIRAVELSVNAGFVPNVDFLFGLPGETQLDRNKTSRLIERLVGMGAKIHSHTFMPLPGTPFRSAAPGDVDAGTRKQIVTLTSQGKAYGKWRSQIEVAQRLAQLRQEQS
jgi:B12-binding domain/radical SAM domain protein